MKKTSELIWQDKQHQVLFELIDQINTSQIDVSIFQRLYDYAENHFAMEEEYMRKLNYPHAEAHIRAHDRFREELDIMMQNCHSYDDQFCHVLAEFLNEWLKRHVFGIDKQLEAFILMSNFK